MRMLDHEFMLALKDGGILHPVLQWVWKDQTLDFQIRSNEAHIYYRGGRLLEIKKDVNSFKCSFDANYVKHDEVILPNFPYMVAKEDDAKVLVSAFPNMKQAIDFYFVNHVDRSEREFQQLIVRENNYSTLSNATDFFIVDIEYETDVCDDNSKKAKAKFDLLAIKWDSDKHLRQKAGLTKSLPKLSICELKYYTQALDGSAGLIKHVEDVTKFLSSEQNVKQLKDDAIMLFQQKRELDLVKFGTKGNTNQINQLDDSIDLILMLANYDPECSKLISAFEKIKAVSSIDVKIAVSNFMGYGLFKESVYSLADFMSSFKKQIYCEQAE